MNMSLTSYEDFVLLVPYEGVYSELLNSEKDIYDGCNMCNYKPVRTHKVKDANAKFKQEIHVRVAPFAAIYFHHKKKPTTHKKKVA